MNKRTRKAAFTLPELMIGLVLIFIIGGVGVSILRVIVNQFTFQDEMTTAQSRLMNAMLRIEANVYNAGLGLPESWDVGALPGALSVLQQPISVVTNNQLYIVMPENHNVVVTNADGLFPASGSFTGDSSLTMSAYSGTVTWNNYLSVISTDLKSRIAIAGGKQIFTVSSFSGISPNGAITMTAPVNSHIGAYSELIFVRAVEFSLDASKTLVVNDFMTAGDQPVVDGIADFWTDYDSTYKTVKIFVVARGSVKHSIPVDTATYSTPDGYSFSVTGDERYYRHIASYKQMRLRN